MENLDPKSQYPIRAPLGSPQRLALLAAYDIEIWANDRPYVRLGRFSHGIIQSLRAYSSAAEVVSPPLSVGAFCEFAASATVIIGGEHKNSNLFNATLGRSGDVYKAFMQVESRALCETNSCKGINIGDGVIVSSNCTVLDGSSVGVGSIIGAQSSVSSHLDSFGVYAGCPARFLRGRFSKLEQEKYRDIDFANVAAHCIPSLPKIALAYQRGDITKDEMRRRLPLLSTRPLVRMSADIKPDHSLGILKVESFSVRGSDVNEPKIAARLHKYFEQLFSKEETVDWVADVFFALGITELNAS